MGAKRSNLGSLVAGEYGICEDCHGPIMFWQKGWEHCRRSDHLDNHTARPGVFVLPIDAKEVRPHTESCT